MSLRSIQACWNGEMLANIGVGANQSDHLLRAIRRAVDSKGHAHATGFRHTRYAGSHFPDATFQDRSKLKGLHTREVIHMSESLASISRDAARRKPAKRLP